MRKRSVLTAPSCSVRFLLSLVNVKASVPNKLVGKCVDTLVIVSLYSSCLHAVSIETTPQIQAWIRIEMMERECETEAFPKLIKLHSLCYISLTHPCSLPLFHPQSPKLSSLQTEQQQLPLSH